jgi:hypothetical protein
MKNIFEFFNGEPREKWRKTKDEEEEEERKN